MDRLANKATCRVACQQLVKTRKFPVADKWARVEMGVSTLSYWMTTDQRTNRPTNKVFYEFARLWQKRINQ